MFLHRMHIQKWLSWYALRVEFGPLMSKVHLLDTSVGPREGWVVSTHWSCLQVLKNNLDICYHCEPGQYLRRANGNVLLSSMTSKLVIKASETGGLYAGFPLVSVVTKGLGRGQSVILFAILKYFNFFFFLFYLWQVKIALALLWAVDSSLSWCSTKTTHEFLNSLWL